MYYCNSRYYVPEWCRWLNVDNPICLNFESSTEINLFVYCNNNPIINVDYDGKWSWKNFLEGRYINLLIDLFLIDVFKNVKFAIICNRIIVK